MAAVVLATINAKWIHPSYALRLLKANLDAKVFCAEPERYRRYSAKTEDLCVIREFALRQQLAEKTAVILADSPLILGLSVSIWNHDAALELLAALEAVWKKGPHCPPAVVLGGPELSGLPPDTELFCHADFVIRGEGEAVFAELCRAVLDDPHEARKRYGAFIDAPPPDPAAISTGYDLYDDEDLRRKLVYVETSRGCPFSCAFCQSAVKKPGVKALRDFPMEPLLADMDRLARRLVEQSAAEPSGVAIVRTIKVLDRSFNINVDRALQIFEFCLEHIRAAKSKGVLLQFHFEMVPASFPEELRAALCRFPPGSLRLEIGIQSFNPLSCALIQRASDPEKELEILRFLRRETPAIVHADLIAGLPGEDLASFGEGFDRLWLALTDVVLPDGAESGEAPFEIQPGILKCLPGTPLRQSRTIRYNKTAPYEVIETDALPAAGMEKIKNYARFWELLVNRRPFPELLSVLAPPGQPVFRRFMDTSQELLSRFGRNWGIPKDQLRAALP